MFSVGAMDGAQTLSYCTQVATDFRLGTVKVQEMVIWVRLPELTY